MSSDSAETSKSRDLIVHPLDVLRGAVQTVVDLVEFIDENRDEIADMRRTFVRVACKSHSEQHEDQHRRAAELFDAHVQSVLKAQDELDRTGIQEFIRESVEKLRADLLELTGDPDDYWRYWQIRQDIARRPSELFLLTKSLFISLVSDFEVLVANTIRAQLQFRPEILNVSEQKYSLADVAAFASIDEFRDYCAEGFSDHVMRGGFDEWMKYFATRHKLVIPGVTTANHVLVEIFQRRHLLVHAGGVVNAQYLQRCETSGGEKLPQRGEVLRVGRNYLLRSANELLSCGIKLMGATASAVTDDATKELVGHLISRHLAYELLKTDQCEAVRDVLEWYLPNVKAEGDRLTCQVNLWIAKKHVSGIDSIRDEVELWDTSVLSDRYKLAKAALLEENDEAYALVKKLLDSEDISVQDWNEWPLLRGVRRHEAEIGAEPLARPVSVRGLPTAEDEAASESLLT